MFPQRKSHQIFDFYHCISKSIYIFLLSLRGVHSLGMPTLLLLWYLILQIGILAVRFLKQASVSFLSFLLFRWSSQLCMITYLHSFFSWVKTKEHIDIILKTGRDERMPVFFTARWKYRVCVLLCGIQLSAIPWTAVRLASPT